MATNMTFFLFGGELTEIVLGVGVSHSSVPLTYRVNIYVTFLFASLDKLFMNNHTQWSSGRVHAWCLGCHCSVPGWLYQRLQKWDLMFPW